MKKLLFLFILLAYPLVVYSQNYCPTPDEYNNKLRSYQLKSMEMMKNGTPSLDKSQALYNEMNQYTKMVLPACISYFKSYKQSYDCSKLQTLSATFMMANDDIQKKAKNYIEGFSPQIKQQCSIQYEALRYIIDSK